MVQQSSGRKPKDEKKRCVNFVRVRIAFHALRSKHLCPCNILNVCREEQSGIGCEINNPHCGPLGPGIATGLNNSYGSSMPLPGVFLSMPNVECFCRGYFVTFKCWTPAYMHICIYVFPYLREIRIPCWASDSPFC